MLNSHAQEISCNFDKNNLCEWTNDKNLKELEWVPSKGLADTEYSSPKTDVSKSGYFVYLNSSLAEPGLRGRLVSPMITKKISENDSK